MASIVTAVLKATLGFLLNKSRDLAADKLKEGDVTEQQFRNMIVREIDDVKSKLDGLARKDLLTSISIFKEGIVFLYKVLDMKSTRKEGTATEQGAVTQGTREGILQLSLRSLETDVENASLVRDMESLDDSGKRALTDAKKRFDEARMKATEAFNNVALSTSDRILAMQYRVMSTILEKIDNPKEAIAACKLCLDELHSMPAVKKSFKVETTRGFLSLFNTGEREQIIQSVRDVNRIILRVTKVVDGVLSGELDEWPCVNIGEKEVNPLIRLDEDTVLRWSFGQEGEEEHKLTRPQSITTNSEGQFIVADNNSIKVFDCSGKFLFSFCPRTELKDIKDVATDRDDNVFVLTISSKVIVFDKEGHMRHSFDVWPASEGISVTVNENRRVFVLLKNLKSTYEDSYTVEVREADGQYVNSFSLKPLERLRAEPAYITAASDNHVMVLLTGCFKYIHVFDAEGHFLEHISVVPSFARVMAFHLSTEHILVPSWKYNGSVIIEIQTKDGKRMRIIDLKTENTDSISGITVTTEGRIAVLCTTEEIERNSQKHLVLVV